MTLKRAIALGISSILTGTVALSGLFGLIPLNRKFNYIELAFSFVMLIVLAPVFAGLLRKR